MKLNQSWIFPEIEKVNYDQWLGQKRAMESPQLKFINSSLKELFEHIGWGGNTTRNQVEQGGLLVGQLFVDESDDRFLGTVHHVIPALSADGSMQHLKIDFNCWREMQDRLDVIQAEEGKSMRILGWYHTHPRYLEVCFSETDRATQRKWFHETWQFALVLNPQKKVWRLFQGADATEIRADLSLKTKENDEEKEK